MKAVIKAHAFEMIYSEEFQLEFLHLMNEEKREEVRVSDHVFSLFFIPYIAAALYQIYRKIC